MGSLQQSDTDIHVYRLHRFSKCIYLFWSLAPIGGMLVFLLDLLPQTVGKSAAWVASLAALACLLLAAYLIALALYSRLTIRGDAIEVRYPLQAKSTTLSDLNGYREVTSRNFGFTVLYSKSGKNAMYIMDTFHTDDSYRQWLGRLRNLDKLSITPS